MAFCSSNKASLKSVSLAGHKKCSDDPCVHPSQQNLIAGTPGRQWLMSPYLITGKCWLHHIWSFSQELVSWQCSSAVMFFLFFLFSWSVKFSKYLLSIKYCCSTPSKSTWFIHRGNEVKQNAASAPPLVFNYEYWESFSVAGVITHSEKRLTVIYTLSVKWSLQKCSLRTVKS